MTMLERNTKQIQRNPKNTLWTTNPLNCRIACDVLGDCVCRVRPGKAVKTGTLVKQRSSVATSKPVLEH